MSTEQSREEQAEQDRENYYLSLNDDDVLAYEEFLLHSNDFINNEIKEQKISGKVRTNYDELKYRFHCEWLQTLNENQFEATKHLELHSSDYINSRIIRAKEEGLIYDNATELKYRLIFENCEPFRDEQIDFTISMMYLCGDIDFPALEPLYRKVINDESNGERKKYKDVGLY